VLLHFDLCTDVDKCFVFGGSLWVKLEHFLHFLFLTFVLFFCCSKESYGGEALFVLNVDYFGDPYRTRSTPKKQEEEPLGSFCQATW